MLKKGNFIILILLVTFLKGLVWSFFIPLWHFPDEQAHFAHVAYLAEGGKPPIGRHPDLSEEILIAEHILRTKRDGWGNNHFTYNPKFNIDYSNSINGLREAEIINLPKETRNNFIKMEAATYPHFFYQLSGLVYKLFYNQNLFIRVFTLRVFWLLGIVGIVWMAFLITKIVFPKNLALQLAVPILVSFQPMFTFISSGITIDNLLNLLFTMTIYNSLILFIRPSLFNLIILFIFSFGALVTKNNSFILLGIIIPALGYFLIKKRKSTLINLTILPLIILGAYFFIPDLKNLVKILLSGKVPFFDLGVSPGLESYSLWQHFKWTIKHTIYEVMPWYWGVFRWLSLALPPWINRIFTRIVIVSAAGLIFKIILIMKKKKLTKSDWLFFFIIYIALFYFLALFIWDWFFYRQNNYSFGIQGRYYFPVIISHMILLAVGFEAFIQLMGRILKRLWLKKIKIDQWQKIFLIFLSLWFIVANCLAFFTLITSYCDSTSFQKFILQASQYKPWFAKGYYLAVLLFVYLISLLWFIKESIKFFYKNENS